MPCVNMKSTITFLTVVLIAYFKFSVCTAFLTDAPFMHSTTRSHGNITAAALTVITARYLNSKLRPESTAIPEDGRLSVEEMYEMYYGKPVASTAYRRAVNEIITANSDTDRLYDTRNDPIYHFDGEAFTEGNNELKRAWSAICVAARQGEHSQARSLTGRYLHALQDFYSRSNWIEMGHTAPHQEMGQNGEWLEARSSTPETVESFILICCSYVAQFLLVSFYMIKKSEWSVLCHYSNQITWQSRYERLDCCDEEETQLHTAA